MKNLISISIILICCNFSFSTNYYSDPLIGSMTNTGGINSPWGSLEDIFNSGQSFVAGDSIFLRNGNHGFPKINNVNTSYVDILAESGHNPIVNRMYFGNVSASSYWRLSNLTIQSINVLTFPISLITLYPNTSYITIQNCTIQSTNQTSSYSRDDWRTKSNNGIRSQGHHHTIENNTIHNVAVGLSIESEHTLIKNNEIQFFVTDGIRGLASYCIYEKNIVKDNIVVFTYAENHYDGFQAYTCCPVGQDTIKDVILRQNLIINTTDPNRNWRGPMQGMSGFDGFFVNWTIENNLVIIDHWHGITLLGAIDCKIINNTVVDPYDISPIDPYDTVSTAIHGPPWVSIKAHKNGSPSYGNIIRNNLTAAPLNTDPGFGVEDHNEVIGSSVNYINYFVDTANFDYHLINSATAIDMGTSTSAPIIDFDDVNRPQGAGYDIGAFEFSSNTTVYNNQTFNICFNDSIIVGSSVYHTSGVYTDTLTTINTGADSIITTTLNVENEINVSCNVVGQTITSNAQNGTYQWINCNNNTLISSATNSSYTPHINGQFAVVITDGFCTDTSDCYSINDVGLSKNKNIPVTLAPNPNNGKFYIFSTNNNYSITIFSVDGKLIDDFKITKHQQYINLGEIEEGIYIVNINTEYSQQTIRLVVE